MITRDYEAILCRRPTFDGPFGDLELGGFNPDAELVVPMLDPVDVPPPAMLLTPAIEDQLRVGLGRVDMEIRWMAWLSDRDELRLWRSWTGNEIYRAQLERRAGRLVVTCLAVESAPGRFTLFEREPAGFVSTLGHVINMLGG